MNDLFEAFEFKKSLYKHLSIIDFDALYRFCKSDNFDIIVSGYLSTEDNSHEKMAAINTFFSKNLIDDPVIINEIEYLVLDLDFLYYSLPYFMEFIELNEVHELSYILKKAIIKNNKSVNFDNQIYFETGFFDSILYGKHETIKINVICFVDSDLWLDYVSSNFEGGFFYNYPLETFIKFSSQKLLCDKETILSGVSICANILEFLSDKFKDDVDIVLTALKSVSTLDEGGGEILSGWALQDASNRLKDNKEVVIVSVSNDGSALDFASAKLKDDKEVVFAAVTATGRALRFASERLQDEKDIVLAAISNDAMALQFASARLQDDTKLVLEAVNSIVYYDEGGTDKSEWAIQFASQRLKNDKEFIIEVVSQVGLALEYISEELRDDKDVVLAAITNNSSALKFASERLRIKYEI
jgi:hypothetical protein